MSLCPCCSSLEFKECCEPLLNGTPAPTPEALMRSRYTAYTLCNVAYLLKTTYPKTRKYYSAKSIEKWAKESTWIKLEIKEATGNLVTFYAYFTDKSGLLQVHKERSAFKQEKGIWYFVDGVEAD